MLITQSNVVTESEDIIISNIFIKDNKLIDYLIEFYPDGFHNIEETVDVYLNNILIPVDDFDTIINLEDNIDIVFRPAEPAMIIVLVVSVLLSYVMMPSLPEDIPIVSEETRRKETGSPVYNINGNRNRENIGGIIPVGYGTTRMFYDRIMEHYTEYLNGFEYSYNLFMIGNGDYEVQKLLVNNTDVMDIFEVEWCTLRPEDFSNIPAAINTKLGLDLESNLVQVLDNPQNVDIQNFNNMGDLIFHYSRDGNKSCIDIWFDPLQPIDFSMLVDNTLYSKFYDFSGFEWNVQLYVTSFSQVDSGGQRYVKIYGDMTGTIPNRRNTCCGKTFTSSSQAFHDEDVTCWHGDIYRYPARDETSFTAVALGNDVWELTFGFDLGEISILLLDMFSVVLKENGVFPSDESTQYFDGRIGGFYHQANCSSIVRHRIISMTKDITYDTDYTNPSRIAYISKMKIKCLNPEENNIPSSGKMKLFLRDSKFIGFDLGFRSSKYSLKSKLYSQASKISLNFLFTRGLYTTKGVSKLPDNSIRLKILFYDDNDSFMDESMFEFEGNIYENYRVNKTFNVPPGATQFSLNRVSNQGANPNEVSNCTLKKVNIFYEDTDHTDYGDCTLLFTRVKAAEAFSDNSLMKINGWNKRLDISNDIKSVTEDILGNNNYGINVPSTDLVINTPDVDDVINGTYTSQNTTYDTINMYTGALKYNINTEGNKIILKKELATELNTHLFNEFSILRDSLKVNYKFKEDNKEFDCIACSYRNSEFESEFVYYPSKLDNPKKMELFGVTSKDKADEIAKFKFKQHLYRRKFITFDTDIEGYIPKIHDKILVSHQLSNITGVSGVILEQSGNRLTVDRDDLVPGTINIKTSTGVPAKYTFELDGDIVVLNTTPLDSVLDLNFSTGVPESYLVTKITPVEDKITIDAVIYDERIYL